MKDPRTQWGVGKRHYMADGDSYPANRKRQAMSKSYDPKRENDLVDFLEVTDDG